MLGTMVMMLSLKPPGANRRCPATAPAADEAGRARLVLDHDGLAILCPIARRRCAPRCRGAAGRQRNDHADRLVGPVRLRLNAGAEQAGGEAGQGRRVGVMVVCLLLLSDVLQQGMAPRCRLSRNAGGAGPRSLTRRLALTGHPDAVDAGHAAGAQFAHQFVDARLEASSSPKASGSIATMALAGAGDAGLILAEVDLRCPAAALSVPASRPTTMAAPIALASDGSEAFLGPRGRRGALAVDHPAHGHGPPRCAAALDLP